jgi:hypothetical protein
MDKNPQIINSFIKCYLIGPIEKVKAGDFGSGWREQLRSELDKRFDEKGNPIYTFDPCVTEADKIGMSAKEFHIQLREWINENNKEKIAEGTNLIWRGKHAIENVGKRKVRLVTILGDCDYVLNSNFLIARMEKGDVPCGTFGEAYEGFKNKIPIYVLQTMSITDYPITFIGWVYASGGDFFETQEKLLKYIDKTYKLEVKG